MSNDTAFARVFKLWAKVSMMLVDGRRNPDEVAAALQTILEKPTRPWREEDGVIYFSVTSEGTTGEEWITRLEAKGYRLTSYTKQVLRSPDFKPTSGVTTEVAILKGMLFEDNRRLTQEIRMSAAARLLTAPNAEVACLIREKFTDEEIKQMGLWWIVTMHEPIDDSVGGPCMLAAVRGIDRCWLSAYYVGPANSPTWKRGLGFAFAVS